MVLLILPAPHFKNKNGGSQAREKAAVTLVFDQAARMICYLKILKVANIILFCTL